ncbi:MAG: YicC family protein [Proteobacteria bacterium]|nr:YicC family protein [Pseudomonadota bacterium]MBU4037296.1 YicC family protein [Pseudomonadota bacterium]
MIKSMTGFASSEKTGENFEVVTEARTYNSKYLDVNLRLPHEYSALEERIRGLIGSMVSRGRIEIKIAIRESNGSSLEFEIDDKKAVAYYNTLLNLKNKLGIDSPISLEMIAGAEGVIKPAENKKDIEAQWPLIKDSVDEALNLLDQMRRKEGEYIAGDFVMRIENIEKLLNSIESESCDLLLYYTERLKDRISILTKDTFEPDAGRIAQEAAFLADRCDISEEVLRVKSHLNQFNIIMNSGEPAGRKLNFLLQEFNREFNTIGSKTEKAIVSHTIVDVKSEIEKLREQVQNIE